MIDGELREKIIKYAQDCVVLDEFEGNHLDSVVRYVQQEIAKAEDGVIQIAHKPCECGQPHHATPVRSVQGGVTSYCQFSRVKLSHSLKEHKEVM